MKKILLFSTLSPYPFWAGSEKYWFDFATDPDVASRATFHAVLGESPVTHSRANDLAASGSRATLFKHFNVSFGRRNLYRLADRARSRAVRTLPWFDRILSEECDLVWFCASTAEQIFDLAYGSERCRQAGVPYWIILQHSFEDFFIPLTEQRELAAAIARDAKRFVFISRRNRFSFERAISEALPNAFHSMNTLSPATLDAALSIPPATPAATARFFNLGRFSPESKGQHLLIEALAAPAWSDRDWQLTFVGLSDDGQKYIGQMAGYFGLHIDRLKFVPFTDNVLDEIGRNEILLMPSLAEGTPYAMIEAMACGRPAVGTPVGGIPELISDGETGWLARTVDVRDVGDALERAWAARDCWADVGAKARENIRTNYSQRDSHARLLDAIEQDTR